MPHDDSTPPSGEWIGFYQYFGSNHATELVAEFAGGVVTGSGADAVGTFTIRGTYDTSTGEVVWVKSYDGAHDVNYRGFHEGGSIWGVWSIGRHLRDGFRIWPRGQAPAAAKQVSAARPVPAGAVRV